MQLYLYQKPSRQGKGKMPNTQLYLLDTVPYCVWLYHTAISSDGGILYMSDPSVNAFYIWVIPL